MNKTIKTVFYAQAAAALGMLGISRYAFNQIFERKAIGTTHRARRRAKNRNEDYETLVKEGQDWLHSRRLHRVAIRSFDGLWLAGHYLKAPDAKRTVIMCHGWRGTWDREFALSARWFYENGCNLLLVEQRAHGQSEGRYMTFGIYERKDLQRWIHWLNRRFMEKQIYLYGCSMGAATVLMTATEVGAEDHVKGIIADCGYSSPYEIIRQTMKAEVPLPEHPFMDIIRLMFRIRTGISLKSYSPLEAMRQSKLPTLFIHGTSDDFVPADMSVRNYDAGDHENVLLLIKNANHCRSFAVNPKAYTRAVSKFFAAQEKDES